MRTFRTGLVSFWVFLLVFSAYAAVIESKWVPLDADSKSRLLKLVQTEVESREGFSTLEEDRLNTRMAEEEKKKEIIAYKAAINAANSEYLRAKKRRDNLTAQFQTASYDFEEFKKNFETLKTGIENIKNQIFRYEQDVKTQQESLKKWLKTEKQGEAIVAVIYTRGFKDKVHDLESQADNVSAPLIAQYMGTYIQSFTRVIDNVLAYDFIRAIEAGTAKWNREEPMRIVLKKNIRGTTYLRIKRYELYPFQAPESGKIDLGDKTVKTNAAVITSMQDLESFLSQNDFSANKYDLGRVDAMLRETAVSNRQAEAGLRDQLLSYKERINYLQEKIANARSDRDFQLPRLKTKTDQFNAMQTDLEVLKLKKDSAEMAFQNSLTALNEKKRIHESIIIKTSLVTTKRSQTPAEASAEAIIEKLEEVRNDAKIQHSSSTTDVVNFQVVGESSTQAVTEAKIIAVRLLSFINEGDSVRVKMAFRVRTSLQEKELPEQKFDPPARYTDARQAAVVAPAPKPEIKTETRPPQPLPSERTPYQQTPAMPSTVVASATAQEFFFELKDVKASGTELNFIVKATNKSGYTKYLAFYDQTSRYTKSTLIDEAGETRVVSEVYLWQDNQKISAYDATRGLAVEDGSHVTVELIFKEMPAGTRMIPTLNLHPYTGVRTFFYRWSSTDVPFQNIRLLK